ncbi:MAG: Tn3 family transposase, partial [Pseudonocardiaceae bacterium]
GDDLPASVKQVKTLLGEVFPQVELAEVVIAIDSVCGFSKHLLHAGGAKNRSPAMLIHLYAAILAQATNLGPVAMARAPQLTPRTQTWRLAVASGLPGRHRQM